MPWIPILYPELDEHLIDTTTILAPTFPNIEQAHNALTAEWSESDQDELDLTGYLVEVDSKGTVKRHIRGDRMMREIELSKSDIKKARSVIGRNTTIWLGSRFDFEQTCDAIDPTQNILDIFHLKTGDRKAKRISDNLEDIKDHGKIDVSYVVDLLRAGAYLLEDLIAKSKRTKKAPNKEKTKSKRTKNDPDKATAKQIAKNAIKIAKGKATEAEIVEAVIRATSIDATEARKIVKEIFPPEPKPKLTTAEEIERKKAKAEREIKKLEPYLDQMSEPSQKTVKSLIRKNVKEELPCIPGPQPTPGEKKEAKAETKKEEKPKAKPKPKAKTTKTAKERFREKAKAKIKRKENPVMKDYSHLDPVVGEKDPETILRSMGYFDGDLYLDDEEVRTSIYVKAMELMDFAIKNRKHMRFETTETRAKKAALAKFLDEYDKEHPPSEEEDIFAQFAK